MPDPGILQLPRPANDIAWGQAAEVIHLPLSNPVQ